MGESIYKNEAAREQRRYLITMLAILLALCCVALMSFGIGYYPLTPAEVAKAFASRFGYQGALRPQAATIFWGIRLPRVLSA